MINPGMKTEKFRSTIPLKISLVFIIIINLVSGCDLIPRSLLNPNKESGEILDNIADKLKNIEFVAELLTPLDSEERLALDVVDEIRGLVNNVTRYTMQFIDSYHYHVVIALSEGSNVTYRYTKISGIDQTETNADNQQIRYRMFLVDGTTQVYDLVYSWPDEKFEGETGLLSGTVLEKGTNAPIPDVLVAVAGFHILTDNTGKFSLINVPVGSHRLVTFPIDGSFSVGQSQVSVAPDLTTSISLELDPLKAVSVQFILKTPPDKSGLAPRIAGNYYQLGNTFKDLGNGMNLISSRLPTLRKVETDEYSVILTFHETNEIHYVYTLGDGYWNVEKGFENKEQYRKVRIPDHDISIVDSVETWQLEGQEPILISAEVPGNTPGSDVIMIQFGTQDWFEPLSMVNKYDNYWEFSLYSPLPTNSPLKYRICRNDQCELSNNPDSFEELVPSPINEKEITRVQIAEWPYWVSPELPSTVIAAEFPQKDDNFITGVSLYPYSYPINPYLYKDTLTKLKSIGVNTVILPISYNVQYDASSQQYIHSQEISSQYLDVNQIASFARENGISLILEPTIFTYQDQSGSLNLSAENFENVMKPWQDIFSEKIINYAHVANKLGLPNLIINATDFFTPAQHFGNSAESLSVGLTESQRSNWFNMLGKIRQVYSQSITCEFDSNDIQSISSTILDSCDALLINLNIPLDDQELEYNYPSLLQTITTYLDEVMLPLSNGHETPIYVEFGQPSMSFAAQKLMEDEMLHENSLNSMLLSPRDTYHISDIDLERQTLFYNILLNSVISRSWISGVIARSFYPQLSLTDASYSINGKPAMDVLWYWYDGIK